MQTKTATDEGVTLDATTAGIWGRHLLCFVLPLTTLAFVLTGPHPWYIAPLFWLPLIASVFADVWSPPERRQPASDLPAWPFDAMLYALVALQLVNIVLTARLISLSGLFSMDALVAIILVGINTGYSAIVVAHELIHRPEPHMQLLGRLMMCTAMYEHFATEHVRGHHKRVGTPEDPATARFGETFHDFWRRTVPAQFKSAWRLESKRLGDAEMQLLDRRMLRHRVLQGVIVESALALGLFAVFGFAAFLIHLLQARQAVLALEAVNYFEHWGIQRQPGRVKPVDSWDTESWFSLYTLVGLSRHADHHAYASRPYQQLRHFEESPKLPYGYFGMVLFVWTRNEAIRRALTRELERRKLGPFRDDVQATRAPELLAPAA